MSAKILLVDDREDNLMSLESILESGGYQFVKATSGREALKILLKEFDFALILMDVKMPNLNGFETATLIYEREKLRHIPIIFVTANNYGEENIFQGYKTGAVDYIYKPINPDLLRAKISVFVDLYRKNHQLLAQEQRLIAANKHLKNEINERIASERRVKELNKKLLENVERLESLNKELDGLAFMASHDLQEPIRKIQTFCDLLAIKIKNEITEEAKKYLVAIQNSAERMQILIRDLLTFSRISSETPGMGECDLNLLLKEVIVDVELKVKEKKATIKVDELPTVYGNVTLLRSLFLNLLENALKYSRKDDAPLVHFSISSENQSRHKEEGQCYISVIDNGIGFEQAYADYIFEMFRRLHSLSEYEGTGIGLAICKKIVEKHNGQISARSELGKGSVFTVRLPLAVSKATQQQDVHADLQFSSDN